MYFVPSLEIKNRFVQKGIHPTKIKVTGVPISKNFNIDSKDEKLSYDLSRGILNDGRVEEFISALNESISVYKKLNASAMIML